MKNKQTEVLWEHTWRVEYDHTPDFEPWVRTFRVVGWSWEHEDGIRRLGALHYEELTTDCMGNLTWVLTGDESVPQYAMAVLLQKIGQIPADADISDVKS